QSYKYNAYTDFDFNNIQSLASYISIALDNANAYQIINDKNSHINSSIEYARNIQHSILPIPKMINQYFETFIIYKPKDIVSGDFYWFTPIKSENDVVEKVFFAVVDCTGHGVPGAFMSLIGNRLLNEIVIEKKIYNPAQILEFLNVGIQVALKQDQTDNNDGMDVVLCCIEKNSSAKKFSDSKTFNITFSGAKRPLYYVESNKNLKMLRGNRKSIGGLRAKRSKVFYENKMVSLTKGDILYLSSDGLIDQNSPKRDRFGSKNFVNLINNIKSKALSEQKLLIETALSDHMKKEDQRDDITTIAIKL
ncbi:PP2C family protein-serine/threonine phosphatase, partial [Bacteroidota bacterium]